MKRTWGFVDDKGEFTGRHFSGPESDLAANTPPGTKPVEGMMPASRAPSDQARIEQLESRQWRAVRELALDPNNAAARAKLESINAGIAKLRSTKVPKD
jgi:hypothetical protein